MFRCPFNCGSSRLPLPVVQQRLDLLLGHGRQRIQNVLLILLAEGVGRLGFVDQELDQPFALVVAQWNGAFQRNDGDLDGGPVAKPLPLLLNGVVFHDLLGSERFVQGFCEQRRSPKSPVASSVCKGSMSCQIWPNAFWSLATAMNFSRHRFHFVEESFHVAAGGQGQLLLLLIGQAQVADRPRRAAT